MALLTRGPQTQLHPPVGRHQLHNGLGPGLALQGACSSLGTSLIHQRTDSGVKKTIILQPTDPACLPAGQTLPWDQQGASPTHLLANTNFGIPWTHTQLSGTGPIHQQYDTISGTPWALQPDSRTWLSSQVGWH